VGDSRVYLYTPTAGRLTKVTEDDTVVNRAFWSGQPLSVALALPNARALTRTIGGRPTLRVDLEVQRWAPGDLVLVCSDGVSDCLDSSAIARALSDPDDLEAT